MRALALAASAVQGIAFSPLSHAEGPKPGSEAQFEFFHYREKQNSGDRMRINSPMAFIRSALSDKTELEASFVLDSMSGASPLYHDTLSGASGLGIKDRRKAGDFTLTHYLEEFALSGGLSASSEDDYDSFGGSLETKIWSSDHNTVFSVGLSKSSDVIGSTNNPLLDEHKSSNGGGIGVTQVLDQNSTIQSNLTLQFSDGYLTDPYKSLDHRPETRDQGAWLTRYVRFFSDADASLHADYRYFKDSWGINAHTMEISWHQKAASFWTLSPHLRLYTQNKADFYRNEFPPDNPGEFFYTADQRLGGFGSLTAGLKVSRDITEKFGVSLMIDYMEQRGSWKIGSPGSPNLDPLTAFIFGAGLNVKF